jgi:hypothetical protein
MDRISVCWPEASMRRYHRQRRVIPFWPGFRPGQKCFSLNQSLNPVKKFFSLVGLRAWPALGCKLVFTVTVTFLHGGLMKYLKTLALLAVFLFLLGQGATARGDCIQEWLVENPPMGNLSDEKVAQFNLLSVWIEQLLPDIFPPPGQPGGAGPFAFRFYDETAAFFGVLQSHQDKIFYLGPLSEYCFLELGVLEALMEYVPSQDDPAAPGEDVADISGEWIATRTFTENPDYPEDIGVPRSMSITIHQTGETLYFDMEISDPPMVVRINGTISGNGDISFDLEDPTDGWAYMSYTGTATSEYMSGIFEGRYNTSSGAIYRGTFTAERL